MKYLKLFDIERNYLGYRDGSDYLKPNVSLCDDKRSVYYNYPPPPKHNGHPYVDLGLPSGTLWATMNVGANKPSNYGKYFQWGDTQGYTVDQVGKDKQFTWNDYKFSINGSSSSFSKYTAGATLDLDDDAAHVHMWGDWHMPTPTQFKELIDNTTRTWAKLDDVNGRLFTSKKDTSKSIFIPAEGYALDGSVHNNGSYGYVWSSMATIYYAGNGQLLNFLSGDAGLGNYDRCCGIPIRGVIG